MKWRDQHVTLSGATFDKFLCTCAERAAPGPAPCPRDGPPGVPRGSVGIRDLWLRAAERRTGELGLDLPVVHSACSQQSESTGWPGPPMGRVPTGIGHRRVRVLTAHPPTPFFRYAARSPSLGPDRRHRRTPAGPRSARRARDGGDGCSLGIRRRPYRILAGRGGRSRAPHPPGSGPIARRNPRSSDEDVRSRDGGRPRRGSRLDLRTLFRGSPSFQRASAFIPRPIGRSRHLPQTPARAVQDFLAPDDPWSPACTRLHRSTPRADSDSGTPEAHRAPVE